MTTHAAVPPPASVETLREVREKDRAPRSAMAPTESPAVVALRKMHVEGHLTDEELAVAIAEHKRTTARPAATPPRPGGGVRRHAWTPADVDLMVHLVEHRETPGDMNAAKAAAVFLEEFNRRAATPRSAGALATKVFENFAEAKVGTLVRALREAAASDPRRNVSRSPYHRWGHNERGLYDRIMSGASAEEVRGWAAGLGFSPNAVARKLASMVVKNRLSPSHPVTVARDAFQDLATHEATMVDVGVPPWVNTHDRPQEGSEPVHVSDPRDPPVASAGDLARDLGDLRTLLAFRDRGLLDDPAFLNGVRRILTT